MERGGKRERRIDVAEAVKSVAELQFLNTIRGLVLDIQSAFVDTLSAKASLTLAQENLKALNDIVSVNTTRVRVGDFDIEGEVRRESMDVGGEPLREQAMRLRPDLQSILRDQQRSAAELKLQVATAKVDYTIGSEYRRQQFPAYSNLLGFFVSVSLPVFNKNQGEIERATRENRQLAMRANAIKSASSAESEGAWQQYQTSKSLLDNIEKQMIEQARDVRTTTEYSYRRGEASFVEFLDAQRAFNDTMQSYNDARADYARSLFLLDSISGKAVNP